MALQYLSNNDLSKFLDTFKNELSKEQLSLINYIIESGVNVRLESHQTISHANSEMKVVSNYIFAFSITGARGEITITF
jgi:hypothetical protein